MLHHAFSDRFVNFEVGCIPQIYSIVLIVIAVAL